MKHKTSVLVAILLLAAVVRVYGVWTFPFEQDELYTIDEATNLFHTKLLPGIQARPVFFLIEHPIMVLLPHAPTILRALPFIFGMLGIWATWALARRTFGDRAAVVAALLVAISPWHMYASGFGRYYSLLYLLAALVYWRLPRAYDSDRPGDYLSTLVPLLIGTWTHPSFVFPVAAAAVAVTLVSHDGLVRWQWPSRTAWTYLWLPFFSCSLLVLGVTRLMHHVSTVANGEDRGLFATLRLIPAMVDWMTPTIFVAGALGALLLAGRGGASRRFGVMALFGVAGMVIALFLLSFRTAIYADYGISALPLVLVSAAGLVQWIANAVIPERQGGVVALLLALLVIGVLPSALSYLSDGTRFDYRPAFAQIAAHGPQDAVFTWPIILQRAYAPHLRSYELPTTAARLDTLLQREHDAWVVTSVKRYGIVGDDRGEIAAWLSDHCRQVTTYQRPRLDYRMYRVDLWRCTAGS